MCRSAGILCDFLAVVAWLFVLRLYGSLSILKSLFGPLLRFRNRARLPGHCSRKLSDSRIYHFFCAGKACSYEVAIAVPSAIASIIPPRHDHKRRDGVHLIKSLLIGISGRKHSIEAVINPPVAFSTKVSCRITFAEAAAVFSFNEIMPFLSITASKKKKFLFLHYFYFISPV